MKLSLSTPVSLRYSAPASASAGISDVAPNPPLRPERALTQQISGIARIYFSPVTFGAQSAVSAATRTRMIATLGPASTSPEMIRKLILAGVNIFRLNFSHGTQDVHGQTVETIRTQSSELKKPVMILADLQGPKIRVGDIPNGSMDLVAGQQVRLVRQGVTTEPGVISTTYPAMIDDIDPTDPKARILLDDGKLELKAISKDADSVVCEVVRGGTLLKRKGINLPGVKVSAPSLSEKDLSDMAYAVGKDVDFIAVSFVRNLNDVLQARKAIQALGKNTPIIAKLEKPEAVEPGNLKQIIEEADGVMVARGDLGVEVPIVRLANIQKRIIREANLRSKPVIVATQMLESMMNSPFPSRPDVTDIANAVADGADILMLSGETSMGSYPEEAVNMMASIIRETETAAPLEETEEVKPEKPIWQIMSETFKSFLESKQVEGIVAYVDKSTVRRSLPTPIRPGWKVVAFTPDEKLFRQLSMLKGIQPIKIERPLDGAATAEAQQKQLKALLQSSGIDQPDIVKPWLMVGEAADSDTPWFSLT